MQPQNNVSTDIMIQPVGIRFFGHESPISFHWIGFPKPAHDYQVRIELKRAGEPSRQICLESYLTSSLIPDSFFDERSIPLTKLMTALDEGRVHGPVETFLQAIFSTHGMLQVTFDRNADDEFLIFQLLLDDIPLLPSLRCAFDDDLHRFFSHIGA